MDDNEQSAPVIWLRQSARFTLGEQRRTVEIAIPVRPGASAEEIERLLGEADAGMAALTRHLDGRIADLIGPASASGTAINVPQVAAAVGSPARPVAPRREDTPATPALPTAAAAPSLAHPGPSAAASAPATTPASAPVTLPPAAASAERPAAAPRPLPPHPAPATAPAAPLAPRPAAPAAPQAARSAAPSAAPSAASAEPLTRPEFLAETRTVGLTPPQVMQRLQVRSLDGLNYREALDLLRRQLLDESGAAAPATPSATAPSAPARTAAPAATSVPAPAPAYFDEEDDYDITLSLPDDAGTSDDGYGDEMDGMSEAASGAAPDSADDLYDVDEIPDVADVAEPRAAPPVPSAAGLARARELLERFRATTPGGAATPDQLKAYTNVIASQLDATQAGTLVRGLWGVAPNRLGTDQLYTLIQWGKDDAFAEEAPAVLAALKAEAAGKAPHASAPSQEVPSPRTARPARSTRANGASGASGGDA